jgi:hypothetical protein
MSPRLNGGRLQAPKNPSAQELAASLSWQDRLTIAKARERGQLATLAQQSRSIDLGIQRRHGGRSSE